PGGGEPVEIERWNIDKDNLKKMLQKDIFGWGYTLFLPTAACNPNVTQVHINVAFTPDNGPPIYCTPNAVRLVYPENYRIPKSVMPNGVQTAQPPRSPVEAQHEAILALKQNAPVQTSVVPVTTQSDFRAPGAPTPVTPTLVPTGPQAYQQPQ